MAHGGPLSREALALLRAQRLLSEQQHFPEPPDATDYTNNDAQSAEFAWRPHPTAAAAGSDASSDVTIASFFEELQRIRAGGAAVSTVAPSSPSRSTAVAAPAHLSSAALWTSQDLPLVPDCNTDILEEQTLASSRSRLQQRQAATVAKTRATATAASQALRNELNRSVQEELLNISELLQRRSAAVKAAEAAVARREEQLTAREAQLGIEHERALRSLRAAHEQDLKECLEQARAESNARIASLESQLEKSQRESRRQRQAFEELRTGNARLRKEAADAAERARIAEEATDHLKRHNQNLQRLKRRPAEAAPAAVGSSPKTSPRKDRHPRSDSDSTSFASLSVSLPLPGQEDPSRGTDASELSASAGPAASSSSSLSPLVSATGALAVELLKWLDDAITAGSWLSVSPRDKVREHVTQTLSQLGSAWPAVVHRQPPAGQLASLRFVHWCLALLSSAAGGAPARSTSGCSAAVRRVGELVLGSSSGPCANGPSLLKAQHPLVRLNAALIVLEALTQADVVAQALEVLSTDMLDSDVRSEFARSRGIHALLHVVSRATRPLQRQALDVVLLVTGDAKVPADESEAFLRELLVEPWFAAFLGVLAHRPGSMPTTDLALKEKLAVVLHRLAKLRGSVRLFEKIRYLLLDELQAHGQSSPFLALNLRAVLLALENHSVTAASASSSSSAAAVQASVNS
eukprot:m.151932 g.151932  ORF g.151932 m.151932 type:complete len:694 (-) comp10159_c2_seq1:105-2186(-)